MPHVIVTASVPDADPDALFARISDYESYANYTEAVREVRVETSVGLETVSSWSVNFRGGILEWRERDLLDPARRSISYEQTEGDFAVFTGGWQVSDRGDTVLVTFTADFDLGMPTLAPMIDPIAQRVLRENMEAIMRGLLGETATFEPLTAAADSAIG